MTITAQRSGRPKILSDQNKKHLIRIVKKDRNIAIDELIDNFNKSLTISVNTSTIRNYLY